MKIMYEVTDFEVKETLVFNGHTYKRTWERTMYGCSSNDPEINEQLESDGHGAIGLLDAAYDVFEGIPILDFLELAKYEEKGEQRD